MPPRASAGLSLRRHEAGDSTLFVFVYLPRTERDGYRLDKILILTGLGWIRVRRVGTQPRRFLYVLAQVRDSIFQLDLDPQPLPPPLFSSSRDRDLSWVRWALWYGISFCLSWTGFVSAMVWTLLVLRKFFTRRALALRLSGQR